ncbi:unnamed protein product [Prorocentrum cordatum]|uniref:Cyclic nucleotide-binding domain-containing protein n=1 Tax=Prorocentrum cordatum TaxID=2364126 RepID=A0ABN9QMS4_9DINO|nr:unnamed protein product [Polarella glacialis]
MHAADTLWLVFILIGFRSAIYDKKGSVVVDAWQIAAHYARTWLFLDLLSAWPAFLAPEGTAAYSACMLLKLSRTPRLAPLISLFQKEYQTHYLTPMKWGLLILLLSHSMACFWRLVQCDVESRIVHGISQHSLDLYCEGSDWWHLYVSDMYWMIMTLSTVGYGDIYPYNTLARMFAIFVMFLGPIFFGSVVAGLTHVMNKLFDETVESAVATMSQFMRRHRVPLGLQRRVERSLRQALRSEVTSSPLDPELFARLSPVLQRTFSFAILNGTIGRFPLFRGAIHSFVAEIAQAHMLVHCSADDLVGEAGQLVEDMVFVVNGKLVACFSATWPDRLDVSIEELAQVGDGTGRLMTQFIGVAAAPTTTNGLTGKRRIMSRGAWFGESCLVNRQHVRTANFIAQGVSELAVLNKEEYVRVMNRYPAMLKRHARFVDGIGQGTISLADISWTPARVQPSWRQQRSTWARATRQQRSTVY